MVSPVSRVFGLVVALWVWPQPSLAGLEICNDTDALQAVSIGYKKGDDWVSEGWWSLDAGSCATPVTGDLKSRYYYYLSKSPGWIFEDDSIAFCTTADVFTITGDQDCAARGYEESLFRKIDTGKTATEYTLYLAGFTRRSTQPPVARVAPPGTWGEPYSSNTAIFQTCQDETGQPFCSFHSDGYKITVYDDGRTPADVMIRLHDYLPGAPIELSGDLEAVYDLNADIVLREVRSRPAND